MYEKSLWKAMTAAPTTPSGCRMKCVYSMKLAQVQSRSEVGYLPESVRWEAGGWQGGISAVVADSHSAAAFRTRRVVENLMNICTTVQYKIPCSQQHPILWSFIPATCLAVLSSFTPLPPCAPLSISSWRSTQSSIHRLP